MTLPSFPPGALFAEHWIVGRVLGRSELALVHEAEDARRARFAALKVFDTVLGRHEAGWTRFEALTRALAELPGDGIARSYDLGIFEGRPFVASERSTFPTLARYVSERGPIEPRTFRDTLLTLASALDTAHRAGIVHGNLKPTNVFVSVDHSAWARLTDFGLAELREAAGVSHARTLGWNAPEVSPAPPSAASDVFSLGLIAFFALSGSPWYSVQRTSKANVAEPRTASERARLYGGELLVALDPWFERSLARDPNDRFANAIDMAHAFTRALEAARSQPPASVGPLSETVPVPRQSPFSTSRPPAPAPFDAHGPTARVIEMTEPMPARAPSRGPEPLTPGAPLTSRPPKRAEVSNTMLFWVGAIVIVALALGLVMWFFASTP